MALPRSLSQLVQEGPGVGPFSPRAWRSPVRGPWLTSVLAAVLLVGLTVVLLTGFLSYAAYDPVLGGSNDQTPQAGVLGAYARWFDWPTSPSWLYRVNQGTHVLLGLALIPVVLGKLWSVAPKLFEWPPVKSPAQALERLSLLLLVGSILFLLVTGAMNVQYDYAWGFSFYTGHFYAAWVFVAAFAAHVAIKLPTMVRSLRERPFGEELRTPTEATVPEPRDPDGLVCEHPAEPTMSRRGVLGVVGGGSLLLLGLSVGQSVDPLRRTAVLSPRGQSYGDGPERLPGQHDLRRDRRRPHRDRLLVAAAAQRSGRPRGGARPQRPARDGDADRGAADLLRRGVVDLAHLDGRPAAPTWPRSSAARTSSRRSSPACSAAAPSRR